MPMTIKRKLKLHGMYYFKFYDHCYYGRLREEEASQPDILTLSLMGELVKEDDIYYTVRIVMASCEGNDEFWKIIKSAIVDIKQIDIKGKND